jgi:2-keto-4-pentenoate hydratase/2-oxohepta-3-ene-1,7-dioic acid hydratase in catechol pathway
MRIARLAHAGVPTVGIVDSEGTTVQPLDGSLDVLELLAAEPAARDALVDGARAGGPVALADARLLAPIQPRTLRDFMTFEEHFEGARKLMGGEVPEQWYERPVFYFSNPNAILGPDEEVAIPPGCGLFDFELEVAAIVSRAGRDLTADAARDHIAGYTILNDWSARDLQAGEMPVGLGPAKAKDFASTLGPWIVTADELEPHRRDDRLHLDLRAAVNGVEIGDDTLANMGWSFEEMLVYASRGVALQPGDVLGSGTCGSGCLVELWGRNAGLTPPPLQPGDEVTLTVEHIGAITTRVAPHAAAPVELPRARPPVRRPRPWDDASA